MKSAPHGAGAPHPRPVGTKEIASGVPWAIAITSALAIAIASNSNRGMKKPRSPIIFKSVCNFSAEGARGGGRPPRGPVGGRGHHKGMGGAI